MDGAFGVSVALLRPVAEVLGRIDEDSAAFLAGLGVTEAMAPNAYVAAADVDRALADIATRRGDPAFALTLARNAAARPLGLFGHMVWLSGTVRDALTRAVKRYAMVTQRSSLSLETDGAVTTLRSTPVSPGVTRGRILTEFPFASLAIRARETTHDAFRLRAVRFAHAGSDGPAYAELFRAPVTFGAAFDELEMDSSQLDLPLVSADPITASVLESTVEQLTASSPPTALVARVRAVALAHGDSEPDVIAKQLGTSERTLRRHLEQEGTTLRAIIDDVRRSKADELLASGVTVKEVAFALGFSEPSAFSRAYKRWTGRAPKA